MRIGAACQIESDAFSSSEALAGGAYRIAGPGCGAVPSRGGSEDAAGAAPGSASAAHSIAASAAHGPVTRAHARDAPGVRERMILICHPPLGRAAGDRDRGDRSYQNTISWCAKNARLFGVT